MIVLVEGHSVARLPISTAVDTHTRNGLYGAYSMPYHTHIGTDIWNSIGYTIGRPKMPLHAGTISPCAGYRVAPKGDTSYRSGKLNYTLQYSNTTQCATIGGIK